MKIKCESANTQAYLRISCIISKNWALLFLLRRCSCSFWNNGQHITNLTTATHTNDIGVHMSSEWIWQT